MLVGSGGGGGGGGLASVGVSWAGLDHGRNLLLANLLRAHQIHVGTIGNNVLDISWNNALDQEEHLLWLLGLLVDRGDLLVALAVLAQNNGQVLGNRGLVVVGLDVLLQDLHGAATGLGLLGLWNKGHLAGNHSLVLANLFLHLLLVDGQHLWTGVVGWLSWALNARGIHQNLLDVRGGGSQMVDEQLVWGIVLVGQATLGVSG